MKNLLLLGQVWGGQISRYALAYMEKNNIDHNTRLWVSIDSPHLGANIPMGIQSMINLLDAFGDSVAAADFYNNQLKSTASQQQLIEQHKIGHLPNYLNGGSPVYQQYYSNLESNGLPNSNGYPQNLRKVAIVNGSLDGTKVGVAGEEDFRIHGFVNQLWWDVKVVEMNTNYMPNTGSNGQVARFWRELKPLRTASYTNNNPRGSLDIVPGGLFNSEDEIHSAVIGAGVGISDWSNGLNFQELALAYYLGIWGDHFESRTNKEVHSFIPTVSALGFNNPNFNWSQKLDRNLVCSGEIPFDSYFGPKVNERHTSFTEESVNWLLLELAGNPQVPNYPLSPNKLNGSEQVCGLETFTFDNCSTPSPVTSWEVSYNLQIVSSNDNSVTVNLISTNSTGGGWIKATFGNGKVIQRNIWLGVPSTISELSHVAVFGCTMGEINAQQSSDIEGVYQYEWIISGGKVVIPNVNSSTYNGISTVFVDPIDGNYGMTVKTRARNDCGVSEWYTKYIPTDCDDGGGLTPLKAVKQKKVNNTSSSPGYIGIYPNPSNGIVNIQLEGVSYSSTGDQGKMEAKLFDTLGRLKKNIQITENKTEVNTSDLETGIYILSISRAGEINNHKLVVK